MNLFFLDVKSDWFKEQCRFHVTSRTYLGIGRSQHASQFRNPRYRIMTCEIVPRARVRKVFHQKKNKQAGTLLLLACVSVSFNIPYSAPQRNSNVQFPSDQDSLTTSVLLIIKRAGTHRRRLGQTAQVVKVIHREGVLCPYGPYLCRTRKHQQSYQQDASETQHRARHGHTKYTFHVINITMQRTRRPKPSEASQQRHTMPAM